MENTSETIFLPRARVWLGWTALFVLLVAGAFHFPRPPASDLDGSWRIAMGYFFQQKFQFGPEAIFTYGPLGFSMGRTYSGLQFGAIVFTQLMFASIGALVIIHEGRRMLGLSRWGFFVAFLLFGISYEDAFHMLVIALMGYQLLRRDGGTKGTVLLTLALSVFATVKFTNLMLAGLSVAVVSGHALWQRNWRQFGLVAGMFLLGTLACWIACGQNPLNFPNYLIGSWSISQGYNESMGIPTPWPPLWKAFIILGVIGSYLILHLVLNPDKPRAWANGLLMAGFILVNWKHGFVRADGHMIGFYFCALLPLTAYPSLLEDPPRLRRLHHAVFCGAILLSMWGLEHSLYGVVRTCVSSLQDTVWGNIENAIWPQQMNQRYHDLLLLQKEAVNLSKTRKLVGRASLDVLGHEQATAIFNDFNYRPRPILQSYSVYNPHLAQRNGRFYSSNLAPDFLLLKIQTIDGRMPMMDDPEVWRVLPHRYDFVHQERGFQLWKRLPEPFDPKAATPRPLKSVRIKPGEKLPLAEFSGKHLWVRIELKRTLLGKLHTFFYKPAPVTLVLEEADGKETKFFMPLSEGDAGFILSPIIEDAVEYAGFANGRPGRNVHGLTVKVKSGDTFLFDDTALVELSEMPRTQSGDRFFNLQNEERFHMFKTFPILYDSHTPPSESSIDDRPVEVLHAPSEMVFNMPKVAHEVSGSFGFLPGAFEKGGNTNGAEFVVYWSNGMEKKELFRKLLDPVRNATDRYIQSFQVPLTGLEGGKLYLRIEPGPFGNYAWDWTYWTGIEIK